MDFLVQSAHKNKIEKLHIFSGEGHTGGKHNCLVLCLNIKYIPSYKWYQYKKEKLLEKISQKMLQK